MSPSIPPEEPALDRGAETARGEVVSVDEDGIRVRLDSDEVVLASGDASSVQEGDRGLFLLDSASSDGVRRAAWISREPSDEPTSFDAEFDELQGALRHHRPTPRRAEEASPSHTLDEERIEAWSKRVSTALTQLRKRRAKRLIEPTNDPN
ncbi:MAG: hypothetical protein AB7V19_04600 [Candidatus Bipolaricaulia bacterium]